VAASRPAAGVSDVLVLAYHAVSERWRADLSVTPARLASQLEGLVARGYRAATFHAAVHAPPHDRTLAVTFDDAYRSILALALPIMQPLEIVGTVFVPTDFTGAKLVWPGIDEWVGGPHDEELQAMSEDELRTLRDAGWEIGSHTCSHPRLTELDDAALQSELVESRLRCEAILGGPCTTIAYPYGDHDDRVVAATHAAGYDAACTLPERMTRPRPLQYPRVGVYHDDSEARFNAKVSPMSRRLRSSRAWPLAARALRRG
jgi:peptidoglycan/xylan/chitin deacetylase (PgdA/CDA1 family)